MDDDRYASSEELLNGFVRLIILQIGNQLTSTKSS